MRKRRLIGIAAVAAIALAAIPAAQAQAGTHDPAARVAALDTRYQAAVKVNDAATMDALLAPDVVLVTGKGHIFTRADLIGSARAMDCTYEQQDEVAGSRTVRVYGDKTAVVTAELWEKGTCKDGSTFDDKLWFSDTYAKRSGTWQYAFGQASRPL